MLNWVTAKLLLLANPGAAPPACPTCVLVNDGWSMKAIGGRSVASALIVYPLSLNCRPMSFRIGNSVWQAMHCMLSWRAKLGRAWQVVAPTSSAIAPVIGPSGSAVFAFFNGSMICEVWFRGFAFPHNHCAYLATLIRRDMCGGRVAARRRFRS